METDIPPVLLLTRQAVYI